jgi:hypothetical protein
MSEHGVIASFEMDDLDGEVRVSFARGIPVLDVDLSEFTERIKIYGEQLISAIHKISDPPNEASIEFGLKLQAQAGVVIAKATTDAHFVVKLVWKNPDHEK